MAVPLVDFSTLGDLGNIYQQSRRQAAREQVLGQLGQGSGPIEYGKAARALLAAGDTEGGLTLARLAETAAERARQQQNADRQHALQERQINATLEGSKVPAGFERDPGSGGLRPVKGGPQDPAYIQASKEAGDRGRHLSVNDITKLSEQGGKLADISRFADTFDDKYAGHVILGGARNWVGRNLPASMTAEDAQKGSSWWQDYDRYKNVVRNELFGSALTKTESDAFYQADITPNMNPALVRKNLEIQKNAVQNAIKKQAGAMIQEGYNPDSVARAFGTKLEDLGIEVKKKGAAASSVAPAKVADKAQYDALKPGTQYIAPDGSLRTKQ